MRAGPAGRRCDLASALLACSDTLSGQSRELLAWPMFPQNVVLEVSAGQLCNCCHLHLVSSRAHSLRLWPLRCRPQSEPFGCTYERITCYALDLSVVEEMLEQPELLPQLQLHVPGCPVSAAAALGDPAKSGFSGGGAGAGAGFEDVETPTLGSCGNMDI